MYIEDIQLSCVALLARVTLLKVHICKLHKHTDSDVACVRRVPGPLVTATLLLQVYRPLEFLFVIAAFTTLTENFLPQLISIPRVRTQWFGGWRCSGQLARVSHGRRRPVCRVGTECRARSWCGSD